MSKPHAPAFAGPQVNIPEGSRAGVNESTPVSQRVPDRISELSAGPNVVEHPGGVTQYAPAKYEIVHTIEDRNGVPREHRMIREDH